ncbi:UNVERIFIED_CONTAM: hypothetical protein DVV46_10740, partial [Lactobacillus paragasseri]|nr:hypothetical protein [Lactobacillus paragasseri]
VGVRPVQLYRSTFHFLWQSLSPSGRPGHTVRPSPGVAPSDANPAHCPHEMKVAGEDATPPGPVGVACDFPRQPQCNRFAQRRNESRPDTGAESDRRATRTGGTTRTPVLLRPLIPQEHTGPRDRVRRSAASVPTNGTSGRAVGQEGQHPDELRGVEG